MIISIISIIAVLLAGFVHLLFDAALLQEASLDALDESYHQEIKLVYHR